jgi:hypothetical protein
VPERAGVLSALGMLVAPPGRLLTRTWLGRWRPRRCAGGAALTIGAPRGATPWRRRGRYGVVAREDSVDLRYRGQSYTLNLPWQGKAATAQGLYRAASARYGHDSTCRWNCQPARAPDRAGACRDLPAPKTAADRGAPRDQTAVVRGAAAAEPGVGARGLLSVQSV